MPSSEESEARTTRCQFCGAEGIDDDHQCDDAEQQETSMSTQPIQWSELVERQLRAEQDGESHTEKDANTFHPSALSRCERQCALSKLGLDDHGVNTLWNFYLGTRQHEDLREWFEGSFPAVEFEKGLSLEVEYDVPDEPVTTMLRFTGHCDVFDPFHDAIYDFKTRKSWKGFDGASNAHKDQITTYMRMAGVERAQLVYVIKSAPWDEEEDIIKTWPEDGFYEFDGDRWEEIRERAERIHDGLREFGQEHDRLPETVDEVPFEPCGCWLCNSEGDDDE